MTSRKPDRGSQGRSPCRFPLDPAVEVTDRLLGPGGCPWDKAQDHESLRPYVIEEAYEVVAAIDGGDPALLKDELGDLLFQVLFHAALASREGLFDVNDVVATIADKLVRRHPHVFGDAEAATAEAVLRQWEDIKKDEVTGAGGDGRGRVRLEAHLPALMQAQKLLEKAARLGRPLPDLPAAAPPPWASPVSGLGEGEVRAREREFGKALLALLERGRRLGIDAELSLREACFELAKRLDAPEGSSRNA
ncbi:MAG: MazG family protein [Bacillota bacterium]|nr:MAG: MazG family protein [Bacillota bacterium]